MKRIRISLTGVADTIKEEVLERFNESEKPKADEVLRCSLGNTFEFYESLGVKVPEDLLKKMKERDEAEDKSFDIKEEDWEEVTSEVVIYEDQIRFMVTNEFGTTIYLKDSSSVSVKESADEIDEYLDFIERPILKRMLDYIKLIIK